jgi:hypothetical protein
MPKPATKDGKVLPNRYAATFITNTKVPVHAPLSGKAIEFFASPWPKEHRLALSG